MTFLDLKPLFDFSQWEIALQQFFCDPVAGGGLFVAPPDELDPTRETWTPAAGNIAFFTAYQNAVFQKARPRVSVAPVSYQVGNDLVLDANSRLQKRYWKVPIEFVVVTQAEYALHCDLLATVRAIAATLNPVADGINQQTTGLNQFLTVHELSQIWDAGNSLATGITADKGAYVTSIKYNATFAVRASAWPGGNLNA